MTDQQRILNQIDRWGTLPNGQPEPHEIKLMRAIMQLSACVADQKRVIDGGHPIRPLDSYPDPMAYFEEE
ncbi:hypothetical protein [Kordiimonas sp.]|uniref:hypothetical protein n=1 Tax=Kordiimonas sp. TaxID=1970157 RepID=UPI003A8E454D